MSGGSDDGGGATDTCGAGYDLEACGECDSECVRGDAGTAVGGVSAHMEVRGAESDAECDLNTCGGYDSETCDGGSSTTASEMSEHVVTRSGGRRRGKQRGSMSQSVRRAVAAKAKAGMGVVASDSDE